MSLIRFPIAVGLTAACFCVGDAGSAEPPRTRPVAALGDTGLADAYSADTLCVRFYSYWHEMTASPDGKYWGNSFKPEAQSNIRKDRWICAEFMLKHNTPGKADGEQAIWIDGISMGHWRGINWRKTPGLKVNALTLESYVTDHWTRNPTNIVYFDNLVIAREYIGPMKQRDEVKEPVRK